MPADPAPPDVRDQITSVLFRLEPGDTVVLGTNVNGLRSPSEFTVERVGKEVSGKDENLYYRVHLVGERGGNYVALPSEKPESKGKWPSPELFHISPTKTFDWGDPYEGTEGNINYIKVERGKPDRE